MSTEVIFDCTRKDWKYKGVLFAEIDCDKLFEDDSHLGPPPIGFYGGILAVVYVDENGHWIYKQRIKFSSGNKQIVTKNFGKDRDENKIIENMCAHFPMKNQIWKKNLKEEGWGIIEILEDFDMIESIRHENA